MLENRQIIQIITDTANANFAPAGVKRVELEPTIDSTGSEALRVTIVIESEAGFHPTGDILLDALVRIGQNLDAAGEGRFPIVDVVTEEELAEPTEDEGDDDAGP